MGNTVSQSNDDYPNLQQRIITYPTDDDEVTSTYSEPGFEYSYVWNQTGQAQC